MDFRDIVLIRETHSGHTEHLYYWKESQLITDAFNEQTEKHFFYEMDEDQFFDMFASEFDSRVKTMTAEVWDWLKNETFAHDLDFELARNEFDKYGSVHYIDCKFVPFVDIDDFQWAVNTLTYDYKSYTLLDGKDEIQEYLIDNFLPFHILDMCNITNREEEIHGV